MSTRRRYAGALPRASHMPAGVSSGGEEAFPPASPFKGVEWSFAFVAFLFYIYVITSYRIAVGTLAMCLALAGMALQRKSLRVPPLIVGFLLLMLWSIVGWFTTSYPDVVWDAILEDGKIALIALVLINVVRSRAQLRFFTIFFLGVFALYPVRGALFSYAAGGTIQGRALWNYIYANPNDLAAFCLLQLSIAVGVYVTERKGWVRRAALAGMVLLPFLILLTQSRGAILAMMVFGIAVAVLQGLRVRRIAVLILIAAVASVAAPSSVWERLGKLTNATSTSNLAAVDQEGSAAQRYEIMRVATTIGFENPIFGVGRGAYKPVHEQYALRPDFDPTARGPRDTHDTYLNFFAESGAPGLAIFLWLVGATLLASRRARRQFRQQRPRAALQLSYLELGLFAYLFAGLFGTFGHLTFTYVHLALIAAATYVLESPSDQRPVAGRRGVAGRHNLRSVALTAQRTAPVAEPQGTLASPRSS